MSRVLLGQSYYQQFDAKLWATMQPYPPLATLYAASYLRAHGHEVSLFDAMLASSEDEWNASLARTRPTIAVLYEDSFNYLSKMCLLRMRQAAFTMIEMARAHGAVVVVAGSDASDHPEPYLARGAAFVIIGEGEETLAELVDRLGRPDDRSFDTIAGLAFKTTRDAPDVVRTARRPDIRNLDAVPFPAWDLVDVDRYRVLWSRRHGYYSVNMVTTRGCPYHCNWCAKPIWGQRYNARSPESVMAEIDWLCTTIGPDHIWFADDIFGLRPGWLVRFAELIEARQRRVPFKCLSRADLLLRAGEVDALQRAGCQMVWIGVESGSQRILDAMEKGTTMSEIREATRKLHNADILVGFFLQFGYPGETRDDIEDTFQFVRECEPDDVGVSVSYPLPGTPFHDRVHTTLGIRQHWVDSSDLAMLYRGPFTTEFYRRLHRLFHAEFRARRAWAQLRGRDRTRTAKRRSRLRAIASLVRHIAAMPFARLAVARAAGRPHASLGPLPYALNPEAAGQPTPQE